MNTANVYFVFLAFVMCPNIGKVEAKITWVSASSARTLVYGCPAPFSCYVVKENKSPITYKWTINGKELSNSKQTVYYTPTEGDELKSAVCTATDSDGSMSDALQTNIRMLKPSEVYTSIKLEPSINFNAKASALGMKYTAVCSRQECGEKGGKPRSKYFVDGKDMGFMEAYEFTPTEKAITIYCQLNVNGVSSRDSRKLTVPAGKKMSYVEIRGPYEYYGEGPLEFKCKATVSEKYAASIKFKWSRDASGESDTFVLRPTQTDHFNKISKIITCTATLDDETLSATKQIRADDLSYRKPTLSLAGSPYLPYYFFKENVETSLQCSIDFMQDLWNIIWYFQPENTSSKKTIDRCADSKICKFTNPSKADVGLYSCRLEYKRMKSQERSEFIGFTKEQGPTCRDAPCTDVPYANGNCIDNICVCDSRAVPSQNFCKPTNGTAPEGETEKPTTKESGNVTVTDRECLDEQAILDLEIPEGVCDKHPESCKYELVTLSNNKTLVCDTETAGGGWILIRRSLTKTNEFITSDYDDYKYGFGNLTGNFWYGLENIHKLCQAKRPCQLRMEMYEDGSRTSTTYKHFTLSGASDFYKIQIKQKEGKGTFDMLNTDGQAFVAKGTPGPKDFMACSEKAGGFWFSSDKQCDADRKALEMVKEMKVRKVKNVAPE